MSIDRGQQFQQDVLPGMERSDSRVHNAARPLPRVAEDMQLSMIMPKHALEKALEENKFKNAFEARGSGIGAGRSSYMANRVGIEEDTFDIPEDAPPEKRPVYGILREKDTVQRYDPHTNTDRQVPSAPSNLEDYPEYGDALVDIKPPKAGQNVTTTEGDSMDTGNYPEQLHSGHYREPRAYYREVQWHDRPSPRTDITGVHISSPDRWKDFLGNEEIGTQKHEDVVGDWRDQAEETGRNLRLSGLRAPVHYWENQIRYQPSMFSAEHFSNPNYDESWTKGQRTEDWSRRQV